MNWADITAIAPLLALAAGAVVVLAAIAIRRHYGVVCLLTGLALATALALIGPAGSAGPRQVSALLYVDGSALFYIGLLIAAALATVALTVRYFRGFPQAEEFHVLLLLATLGAAVLVAGNNMVSFFLGLELLSIPLYVLIAYVNTRADSIEAGLKYLILAGASSALLLAGMALIYAECGSLGWTAVVAAARPCAPWMSAGLGLILTGLALPGRGAAGGNLYRHDQQGRSIGSGDALSDPPARHRRRSRGNGRAGRVGDDHRQPAGPASAQSQTLAGVFVHRPHGLPAGGGAGRRAGRPDGRGVLYGRLHRGDAGGLRGSVGPGHAS
jgi:hypothetical protein